MKNLRSIGNLLARLLSPPLGPLVEPRQGKLTPLCFHDFTYSKRSHFQSLPRHKEHQRENINNCDLKIYQTSCGKRQNDPACFCNRP